MAGRVEASLTEGESTIEERDREAMREFEEGLDQPMDEEANMLKNMNKEKGLSMLMLLRLSFQSLGIVYGDLGTSPLYVFYNTFPNGIDDSEDVIGALSLIIYSLLLIPLIKYVLIVCKANDNGQVLSATGGIKVNNPKMSSVKKYEFEVHSRVSMSWILGLGPSLGLVRVPGIGLVHTELASGVPHIFSHFITNLPAIHSVVVFVCVKNLLVYTVPEEERFLVKRIGPKTFRMFRCVARYGYKDLHRKDDRFEDKLFENLFSFIQNETMMESDSNYSNSVYPVNYTQESRDELISNNNNNHDSIDNNMVMFSSMVDYMDTMSFSQNITVEEEEEEEDELEFLKTCKESGVVHIMGNTVVKARKGSLLPKKIAIDYVYAFLAKICRENSAILHVPHETLLNVGQVYYL
uniref:Potassium transporter n=1 Tax=Brassica campestris TaxID=3711 RepID=M4D7R5_BRACM